MHSNLCFNFCFDFVLFFHTFHVHALSFSEASTTDDVFGSLSTPTKRPFDSGRPQRSATAPLHAPLSLCVLSIALVMPAAGESSHQHHCTGTEWAGCFLSIVRGKNKTKQTHRFTSNRLSGVWIDPISSYLYCYLSRLTALSLSDGPTSFLHESLWMLLLLRTRLGGGRGTLWLVGHSKSRKIHKIMCALSIWKWSKVDVQQNICLKPQIIRFSLSSILQGATDY